MRASHEWLRGFVPHALAPDRIERLLSTHVATVDGIEALRADLAPIVIARVLTAEPHPDSDHLWVTKVDDGSAAPLDVVCGASNVKAGRFYPFARTGTTLPNGIKIEKRKIRGAVSNGMLCSARELGLGEEHDGILELSVDVAPGTPFLAAVPTGDVRYEIDVLPNRPDLLSHVGLARELSALTGVAMQLPPELAALPGGANVPVAAGSGVVGGVTVRVDDSEGCPRYAAAVIRGVTIGPSPAWLRERVESVGGRSISNVVDITNYFLHGYGQPMHAFDLAKLGGSSVVIRRANAGEKLITLDGVERTLTNATLVIADATRAHAVAGVIGGKDSEVTTATTDVLLEVANFDPRSVRRTRRALEINTDASHRFERGTDPALPAQVTGLAAALIASVCGGTVDGTPLLVGAPHEERHGVTLRPARVSRLLGADVPAKEIIERLGAIGFAVNGRGESLAVMPPSWRHDISRDVDLIEEVARLRGYDTLSDTLAPFRPSAAPDASLALVMRRVRDALVVAGFAEVRPLPFVRGDDATHMRVTNPLADDEPHLRTGILETLARRAEYNLSRREGDLRLFEVGSVFRPEPDGVRETCHVGALMMGARRPVHFSESAPPAFDAWDAKALAEETARALAPGAVVVLQPGEGAHLWTVTADAASLGVVQLLTLDAPPWAAPAFGIELVVGRLSLDAVAGPGQHAYTPPENLLGSTPHARYRALPVMPAAVFDLAFLVPDAVSAGQVEETLRRSGGELLETVVLFDEFRGAGVSDGQRSLAWRLTFRHPERTLNEKEIAARRQKLITTVEKEHGVVARTS
jgi:phenylalanyl-tRNA synthetase beta chain